MIVFNKRNFTSVETTSFFPSSFEGLGLVSFLLSTLEEELSEDELELSDSESDDLEALLGFETLESFLDFDFEDSEFLEDDSDEEEDSEEEEDDSFPGIFQCDIVASKLNNSQYEAIQLRSN